MRTPEKQKKGSVKMESTLRRFSPYYGYGIGAVSIAIALAMTSVFANKIQNTKIAAELLLIPAGVAFSGFLLIILNILEDVVLMPESSWTRTVKGDSRGMIAISLGAILAVVWHGTTATHTLEVMLVVLLGVISTVIAQKSAFFSSKIVTSWVSVYALFFIVGACLAFGGRTSVDTLTLLSENLQVQEGKIILVSCNSCTNVQIWGQMFFLSITATGTLPGFWVVSAGISAIVLSLLSLRQLATDYLR